MARRGAKSSDHYYSTEQVGWLLGQSASAVRRMIKDGEIAGVRLPAGFRVKRDEAIRISRARIEGETDQRLSDREVERLIDETIATNERLTQGT
jgi:excisionase family DNA binding protein